MKKDIILAGPVILCLVLAACSGGGAETAAAASAATQTPAADVTEALATPAAPMATGETHDDTGDYTWDAREEISITLSGDSIAAGGAGVTVDGSTATITAAGTYRLSGSLADGRIIVNSSEDGAVRLILDGVDIRSQTSAAITIQDADKALVVLADGSQNYLYDGETVVYDDAEAEEPNAAVFSKADLTILGNGALTVVGNFNDGIASKDGLIIAGGSLTVSAVDEGIRGKDYLVVKAGAVTVTAGGDGLKADNDDDASLGYIAVETGVLNITSGGDAISAQTAVNIAGGEFTLNAGGGSATQVAGDASPLAGDVAAKGIKGLVSVTIDGGAFTIDAADDAVHSNDSITVNDGQFSLSTGDDGMHADAALTVNGGEISVLHSYEGLESAVIAINAGDIYVVSSDDGINVAGGADGSGMGPGMGFGGMPVGMEGTQVAPGEGFGGGPGGRPGGGPGGMQGTPMAPGGEGGMTPRGAGRDMFTASGDYHLYINGGTIVVNADGDGIDANGSIEMNGGLVIVNGPTQQMNGALDYMGGFTLTGGTLVAAGSAGMAQSPDASSSQNVVMVNFNTGLAAGDLVHIQDASGADILTFAPGKAYQSLVFSSPALASGATYDIYVGGTSSGSAMDGLYLDGTYTPGSAYANFTIASAVTTLGGRGGQP